MGDIQQDPSMEEILASIKRVIREDGRAPVQSRSPSRAAKAEPAGSDDDDVLELNEPMAGQETLVSEDAAAASRHSLAALSAARPSPPPAGDGGALDAVVRDMLRPMLKDWLDEHLPQIVEELVTREIARISGR
jgi:cell pole-organizing protein PopZ